MSDLKGLRASIYRNAKHGTSANGGISERAAEVIVVGIRDQRWPIPTEQWRTVKPLPAESQMYDPRPDAPAVVLVYRNMGTEQLVHAEPLDPPAPGTTGYMDGGSFVSSTDGRFRDLIGFYGAVSLHDRCERPWS